MMDFARLPLDLAGLLALSGGPADDPQPVPADATAGA